MSLKQTWKTSTCLAIGATAFALGLSTIPSLAGGGGREMGRIHETMARVGGGAGEMHTALSGAGAGIRVVNVSSANAMFSRTGGGAPHADLPQASSQRTIQENSNAPSAVGFRVLHTPGNQSADGRLIVTPLPPTPVVQNAPVAARLPSWAAHVSPQAPPARPLRSPEPPVLPPTSD